MTAKQLRKLRESRGESQAAFAKSLSSILGRTVARETVTRWETGSIDVKASHIPWHLVIRALKEES
jgi:transcriptional regulator with XRE-family HTH domain